MVVIKVRSEFMERRDLDLGLNQVEDDQGHQSERPAPADSLDQDLDGLDL